MFERYTEKSRRVIFFGRYEASRFGSHFIESEHLLLGLLRERGNMLGAIVTDDLRKEIESRLAASKPILTSVDLPLSDKCKRVLSYAAEEAERLGHNFISTDHLVLGLLREPSLAKELLEQHGLELPKLRAEIQPAKALDGQEIEGKRKQAVEFVRASLANEDVAAINVRLLHLESEVKTINAKLDKLLEKFGD